MQHINESEKHNIKLKNSQVGSCDCNHSHTRTSQISYKSIAFKICRGAQNAKKPRYGKALPKRKRPSVASVPSVAVGRIRKSQRAVNISQLNFQPASGTTQEDFLWIRIPRNLGHRIGVCHQPAGEIRAIWLRPMSQKVWSIKPRMSLSVTPSHWGSLQSCAEQPVEMSWG